MKVLVTGGAGYIGSHAVVTLVEAGHDVVVLDNLCNSSKEALRRVETITGRKTDFVQGDVRDIALLRRVFNGDEPRWAQGEKPFDAVMHFAALKSVGGSVNHPAKYYDNNVGGTVALCKAMAEAGVFRIVFSSSATVYGEPETVPIREDCPRGVPTNPYGYSKLMVEQILTDLARSDERWSVALLRYFNPVGAHPSALIGEDPADPPGNLVPCIAQVAVGKRKFLSVLGGDWPTQDGTGVRDYIHVIDLVKGHLSALDAISEASGVFTWNLGTGRGYSVLDVVRAFESTCGRRIPFRIVERRPGDIAECWSDPRKAESEIGWRAERGLADMVADAWRWQENNPDGYEASTSL